jgi:DNA-directed RNA polymerase subunit RPC12/RpoP
MTYEQIRAQVEAEMKARKIWCPYCGTEYHDEEYSHVNYHTPDEPKVATCHHCDKDFLVKEHVERTYKTAKCGEGFE